MVLDINADILWYQCFLFKLVSVGYKFLLSKPISRFPSVAIFVRRHRNTAKFWLYLSLCTSTEKLVLQVIVKCRTCDCPQLFYQRENFCLLLYIMKVLQNPLLCRQNMLRQIVHTSVIEVVPLLPAVLP